MESYAQLASALAHIGLAGQMMRPDQLVVSAQEGPVWPNRGNSFWMSRRQGFWYLSTWLPICYRVPQAENLVALCSACMQVGTSAMYRVPEDIVGKFGLQEIGNAEFGRLFEGDDNETMG
jgi:hypothetical protein